MHPAINAFDVIRAIPTARRFDIGDLQFARFSCPPQDGTVCLWAQTDHLIHVLTGESTWKTATRTWKVAAGETVFFKKGASLSPPHADPGLCLLVFFIPDAFVRETVRELSADLPPITEPPEAREPVIRVHGDMAVTAFIHAMTDYFAAPEDAPKPLLRLKLKELVTSILTGPSNGALSAYFRWLASQSAPPIAPIMEANFRHNLPLGTFAQLCHRSLSSFKREFRRHYGTTPGRWLVERRLECAAGLLRATRLSVTEIGFESGFEDAAHFSRAFKRKFGRSPRAYREAGEMSAGQPAVSGAAAPTFPA